MRLKLTPEQNRLHRQALDLSARHRTVEAELCACLREVNRTRLYKSLGRRSLFQYAIRDLRLAESVAYAFIAVARKSGEIPELKCAIENHSLSVSKASRVVSGLTSENAVEVIAFAETHTSREIDCDMARRNPRARKRDRIKPVSSEDFEVRAQISKATHVKLERAQSLLAQKGKFTAIESVLEAALEEFLNHHDPVRKAERAQARKVRRAAQAAAQSVDQHVAQAAAQQATQRAAQRAAQDANQSATQHATQSAVQGAAQDANRCATQQTAQDEKISSAPEKLVPQDSATELRPNRVNQSEGRHRRTARIPLSAETRHAVFLRDQGRCTHIDEHGERCGSDRWIDTHHIKQISHGGTNELSNLTTLCSFHHDLVHQLSFPLEGQFNWLRAPRMAYRAWWGRQIY